MPRLRPVLFWRARDISPHLDTLLPACRDLGSARSELRWIREHVYANVDARTPKERTCQSVRRTDRRGKERQVGRLCYLRGKRGLPLQYVLGSQPFGGLDIKCRPGVLIPRPETEAWVYHLARQISRQTDLAKRKDLRIVDFCSGSGCISLLLYSLLRGKLGVSVAVSGFDVEAGAVDLATENIGRNARQLGLGSSPPPSSDGRGGGRIAFGRADIFATDWSASSLLDDSSGKGAGRGAPEIDILVSNPPYVSTRGFDRDTGRSVRNHEPKLALVPPPPERLLASRACASCAREDVFYARLLEVADLLRSKILVVEVGDLAQGIRVVEMALRKASTSADWDVVELWRDWPDMSPEEDEQIVVQAFGLEIPVRGSGNGRAVFLRRSLESRSHDI